MTINEISKVAEKETWVDTELDKRQIELGKKENDFVIDGRLSWHFIPNSLKVYLDVSDEKAAERIWQDKENRQKSEKFESFDDLVKKIKQRKASEIKRYKKYYGINHHDKNNYDLVIDTANISAEEVTKKIINHTRKLHCN